MESSDTRKLSFGKDNNLTVKLDKTAGETYKLDMDIIPPVEGANMPEVTPEQRAENNRRMALGGLYPQCLRGYVYDGR